jgi:hypothetical protein
MIFSDKALALETDKAKVKRDEGNDEGNQRWIQAQTAGTVTTVAQRKFSII